VSQIQAVDLKNYLSVRGRQAALAAATGLSPAYIWQMANGIRPVPIKRCIAIERATQGSVTRYELRPNDHHLIWLKPDDAFSAPPPPSAEWEAK
jgi:DNA-binding transcriptional regulator YdaS (Cro superfamily)